MSEQLTLSYQPFRRTDMTIAIEDISTTEQLARGARTAVRGGIAYTLPATISGPAPWGACLPQFPSFPSGFPFNGWNPVVQPEPKFMPVDAQNQTAQ
jgi:hypothetical protein